MWIGLTDRVTEGYFEWLDESDVNYTYWERGQPDNSGGDENCVHMGYYGTGWNDQGCERTTNANALLCNHR